MIKFTPKFLAALKEISVKAETKKSTSKIMRPRIHACGVRTTK